MKKLIIFSLLAITFTLSACTLGVDNTIQKNNQCSTNDDCIKLFPNTSNLPGPDPKYICENQICVRNLD